MVENGIITSYVFIINFKTWKKLICSNKSHIKSKKCHQQKSFLYNFYIWTWKCCQNWLIFGWDIANLWFRDDVQNFKTCIKLWLNNMSQIKKIICKIVLSFKFTVIWEHLVHIFWLVTETQIFGENVCSILLYQFIRKVWPIWKKTSSAKQF